MEPPIIIGTVAGSTWTTEVYHKLCAQCGKPIEVIKYADVPPLEDGVKVLCKVCLANHYQN
jgi:hypothetical protein